MICRRFLHHNVWVWNYISRDKLDKFNAPEVTRFKEFLHREIPNAFESWTRVSDLVTKKETNKIKFDSRPSRYSNIIRNVRQDVSRHYAVLKALVESPDTNFVTCELPVWSEPRRVCGHIDLVELSDTKPCIKIWDYKPGKLADVDFVQVLEYRELLAECIGVKEIQVGLFNEAFELKAKSFTKLI